MESQKKFAPTFSFEFFPPQTPEGIEKLRATRRQLAQLDPKFFSVTFGAGGSTRARTLDTVLEIQAEGYTVAPHLSCIGATGENIRNILKQYRDRGVAGRPPERSQRVDEVAAKVGEHPRPRRLAGRQVRRPSQSIDGEHEIKSDPTGLRNLLPLGTR